jgi:octaprenyl-diphosphate synthase
MKQLTFENTILSIHKDIQVKLKKTNETIDRYIKSEISIIPKLSKYFFNKRGKQLRPVLCLLSSKMINSNYSQINTDISMAAALEFIHGATLLHDDVIDKGKIRRGQRSINDIWNNKFSVLLGDFMFSKSFQLMTKGNSLSAMESLAEVSSKISEGEFLQLSNEQNINIKIEEYINIISLKTAELFGAAMKVPAILTNKSPKLIKQLNTLGVNYGIIFQIIDDNLDYFGGKEIGKVIGQDFLEGKVTLPIILLLKKINKDQKEKINTLFQKKKRTIKELKEIIKLLQKYEIEQECREYAEKISVKSIIILNNFKNKQSQLLKELLVTSIKRES